MASIRLIVFAWCSTTTACGVAFESGTSSGGAGSNATGGAGATSAGTAATTSGNGGREVGVGGFGGGSSGGGGTGGDEGGCSRDEVAFGGHCYVVSDATATWSVARQSCLSRGAGWDLATVTSQPELDWIVGFIDNDLFLGATDDDGSGTFVWVTGAPWFFEAWASGEPTAGNGQNCLGVNVGDGLFHDHDCDAPDHYLCEWIPENEAPN